MLRELRTEQRYEIYVNLVSTLNLIHDNKYCELNKCSFLRRVGVSQRDA